MEQWRKGTRKEPIIIDIDSLVPADHLLRKIEKVMDYECQGKARHAKYTPPRSGRSYEMGQAQMRCHESEKNGKLELEKLLFLIF